MRVGSYILEALLIETDRIQQENELKLVDWWCFV